jgi:outer membrane protein OmpA-like peptidoglycan-associated protein
MEQDKTQVGPMPRPSGSGRPRLVLGVALLLVGLGDLLFMNIVLLPQVLAVEVVSPARPTVSAVPVPEAPVQARPKAGLAAPELAAGPALAPSPPAEEPAPAPTPVPTTRSLPPLLFIRSTAWLSPKAEDALAKLADVMKADPSLRVRLDGHTDDYGPERFNEMLSLKRARRARAYLQDLGIAQARIDIKGHGSEQPAETARNATARAHNRRVEITFN